MRHPEVKRVPVARSSGHPGTKIRASNGGSSLMDDHHTRRRLQQAELYAETPRHPVTRQMRRHFDGARHAS